MYTLDANVIGHLVSHTAKLGQKDADRLLALRTAGKIEPVFNVLGFEEQLAAGPEKAERLFDYALKLLDPDKVVKEPKDLFFDDIRSYAHNGCADSPYYSGKKLAILQQGIKDVLSNYTQEKYAELYSNVVDPSWQKSLQLQNGLENAAHRIQAAGSKKELKKWRKETPFPRFWGQWAESWAESFATASGVLAECKKRGIQDLLEIPSVHMGVGIIVAHLYNYFVEGKKPERSDSIDWLHASAAAATTDRFVSHDKRLRRLCDLVSLDDFQALLLPIFMDEVDT